MRNEPTESFGLLNVLKPPGMTSHDVVGFARRVLGTRRVGHGGTLDPAACGVMALAVGKATRLLPYLLTDKHYLAEVAFGLATDTLDAEGVVAARADAGALTREALEAQLAGFRGPITQRPPMTSAVHVGGKRLYELARAGVALPQAEIPARQVVIHDLRLLDFTPGSRATARLAIGCGAGTYIRSLAADLGAALGFPASLAFLLRDGAGALTLSDSQTLEELAAAPRFLPEECWLGHLPAIRLSAGDVEDVRHGRQVPGAIQAPTVRLTDSDGQLVALARPEGDRLQPLLVF